MILIGMITVTPVQAGPPEVGWQAELETLFHDVSGTVTIVDNDTIRIDDFIYDGGGPLVFFYLGSSNTDPAFNAGLRVGSRLDGPPFDGFQAPLIVDLSPGETLDGYRLVRPD